MGLCMALSRRGWTDCLPTVFQAGRRVNFSGSKGKNLTFLQEEPCIEQAAKGEEEAIEGNVAGGLPEDGVELSAAAYALHAAVGAGMNGEIDKGQEEREPLMGEKIG